MRVASLILLLALSSAVRAQDSMAIKKMPAGEVKMIPVRNGKYKVWTQKVGSGKYKLLLLAGGPGSSFEYFENFPQYLSNNYEIYFYSQLGSYLSDQPSDSTLQTIDGYVEEVEEVRKAMGLDNFFLLGHSWGTRLALAYAARYQQHVKGLIMSNGSGLGKALWNNEPYQQRLWADIVAGIPEYSIYADSIRSFGMTEQSRPDVMSTIMKKARPVYIKKHFMRLDSVPDAVYRSRIHSRKESDMRWLIADTENQESESLLAKIKIPVLFIGGQHDYIDPDSYRIAKSMVKSSSKVTVVITPNGSHRPMWDDPENYFEAIRVFIAKNNK
jgi:proline iminopeptidase